MPSPFPGMDPYFEGGLWTSIQAQMAVEVARQLIPRLRPRYIALSERRNVVTTNDDFEVRIAGLMQMPESVPHTWVEIRDTASRRLVTTIEFLSPTTKQGSGRRDYLQKRQRLLIGTAHLMEIDLLRQGYRVLMQQPLPAAEYFVFLSRNDSRQRAAVWPIALQDRLPVVPVPLLPGDADVPLDLQLAFTNVYDLGGYDLAADYTQLPDVPLPSAAAAWADALLRAAGRRS